jgi:ketosteroid isomerase-like protein
MATENIEQVVHLYFAAICAMDPDLWLAAFAEDAVSHDPVGTPPRVGHAALRQAMQELCDAVEQVGRYADHVFVAGNGAAIKWTGRCIGRNGRAVTFAGIDIMTVDAAGKIQTVMTYWDPQAMRAELESRDWPGG